MYCFCVWFAVRHTEHRPPFPPASYTTSAVAFEQPCRRRHRQRRVVADERTDDDYRWTHGRRRIGLVGPYARRSCFGGPAGTRPKIDADIGRVRLDETHSSSFVRTTRLVAGHDRHRYDRHHHHPVFQVRAQLCLDELLLRSLAVLRPCVAICVDVFPKQPPSGVSHVGLARYCRPVTG